MSESKKAWLALENGVVMEGLSIGAEGEKGGDLVFNTAMSGYQEILTDPSYAGQVVIMTYPLIGNYGIAEEDSESGRAWAEAFVVRELSNITSNHRADYSLGDWLKKSGIVAIEDVVNHEGIAVDFNALRHGRRQEEHRRSSRRARARKEHKHFDRIEWLHPVSKQCIIDLCNL